MKKNIYDNPFFKELEKITEGIFETELLPYQFEYEDLKPLREYYLNHERYKQKNAVFKPIKKQMLEFFNLKREPQIIEMEEFITKAKEWNELHKNNTKQPLRLLNIMFSGFNVDREGSKYYIISKETFFTDYKNFPPDSQPLD